MTNDELAEHLVSIRAASGALTPEAVVGAASDPAHPLHSQFNWDDVEAAEAWRRQQARILIARVRIVVAKTTARGVREVSVRGLASVLSGETRQYVPVSEIKADPVLSEQLLDQIRSEMAALKRKYSAYGDLFRQVAVEVVDAEAAA